MTTQTERIRDLNDTARRHFTCRVLMTAGVSALNATDMTLLLHKVRTFDAFSPDNDPHGEHDFGAIDHNGTRYFWKIDYYAPDMLHGSEDPADPAKTCRVMTIMQASEY